jgi:multiple sugar transport system ATP-binding protein
MAEVIVRNVKKRYGPVQVMHGVSVDIEDGQFVVLVGPSGCGKSTLLRMIAGLEQISEGEIAIGGRVVNDVMPKDRDIAMVFQSYALYPHKTVGENMGFALKIKGAPRAEIAEKVGRAASILDLGHLLERYPKQLSGGQRQRVAMGRAIVRDPAVFGTTIVYVTHDQIEAMTMADKIVVMRDGRVEQVGAPLDLYDNPTNTFVAGFIGSPAMNFIRGRVEEPGTFLADGGARLPLPDVAAAPGRAIVYGIRPEHIDIGEGGVPARVSVLEPTGSETQVFARLGTDPIDAVVKDRLAVTPGTEIPLRLDPRRVHVFDGESGARIS